MDTYLALAIALINKNTNPAAKKYFFFVDRFIARSGPKPRVQVTEDRTPQEAADRYWSMLTQATARGYTVQTTQVRRYTHATLDPLFRLEEYLGIVSMAMELLLSEWMNEVPSHPCPTLPVTGLPDGVLPPMLSAFEGQSALLALADPETPFSWIERYLTTSPRDRFLSHLTIGHPSADPYLPLTSR
jgi:hypothetical protein